MQSNQQLVAHAQEPQEIFDHDNTSALEMIECIEVELQEKGTSILEELYNQRELYLDEYVKSTNDRQSTIIMILGSIDEAIASFERNTHQSQSQSNVRQNRSNVIQATSLAIFNISPNCTCDWLNYLLDSPCGNCIMYSNSMMAVAAIATGFSVRGWSLAADLIWFNRSNTTEDTHYWPSLGYRVAESSFINNNVAYKPEVTAGVRDNDIGRFNGLFDNIYTGDTYNSLGAFWYSKTGISNGNVAISIIDRYDWTRGSNSSGGVFNNTMAFAQDIGVVKPFYTRINVTVPGTVPFNWEYTDNGVAITGAPSGITTINLSTEIHDLRIYPRDGIEQPKVNITSIGDSAFSNQTQLYQISIPDSVTSIGSNSFENCTSLTSITLPNTLTSIGRASFKGCERLSSIIIPNSITSIGSNAFENCTNLKFITLPNNLISIGDSAFKGCVSLESIIIPNSVTTIGSNAFENCTKLENVTVLRENAFITNLGPNAFHGCNLLREIIVSINRVAEYKNKVNWSSYSQKIIPSSSNFDEYDLNCLKYFDVTTTLGSGYNKIYKFEVECAKSYKITSSALSAIKMTLYNSNMKLLNNSPTMSNDNCTGIFTIYLSPGTYYIDLRFDDNLSSGNIKTSHELTWANNGWDISFNTDNNVLSHLHEIEPGLYKNKLQYFNNQGAGFYELKLSGTKTDATDVYYPEGAITIYNDSSRTTLLNKFTLAGYPNQAKTSNETNSMVVYLPRNGYFYIDVNMTSNNLSSLKLYINPIGSQELSLYNLPESTNESIDIFNETSKGDYFQKLNINQTGKFTVYASYTGFQTNTLFVLAKLNYNSTLNTYTLETKIADILSAKEYPDSKTLTLDEGTYYIGYFNKNDDISLDVSIDRLVTQSGSHVLVTDPDSATPSGSQINIIEMNNPLKSYRQSFITKGFTRIIYPDYNYEVPASRLDYHWYSSNENIATVTDFGTVLGKNVGTVKIMAVLKEDPSKVFVKEFTIIEDTGTEPFVVNSTLTVKYSETDNGTFKLNLEKVNCPYPWFQDYNWNLYIPCQGNDISVIYDVWGFITVSDTGEFILTGNYLKNSRVTVIINVIIEP